MKKKDYITYLEKVYNAAQLNGNIILYDGEVYEGTIWVFNEDLITMSVVRPLSTSTIIFYEKGYDNDSKNIKKRLKVLREVMI